MLVPVAYIDGKKVAQVAEATDLEVPKVSQLLTCLVNYEDVAPLINLPETKFKGKFGPALAATTIQKHWRRFRMRSKYLEVQKQNRHARVFQRVWASRKKLIATRKKLQSIRDTEEASWRIKVEKWKQNWKNNKQSRRIIIHLPALDFEHEIRVNTAKFNRTQNSQLLRYICFSSVI